MGHQLVNSVYNIALICFDDKRYILDDTVSSLAYGHYSLAVSLQESSKSEKSYVNVELFQYFVFDRKEFFLVEKFFVVDKTLNESHTESDSSSEAVDEISTGTDDDNADHETDEEDVDFDSTASTARNYNKTAQASCSANVLFVNNDGSLVKAWKATSSFCELVTLVSRPN